MSKKDIGLLVSAGEGVRLIQFNRPSKRNAISLPMYKELRNILNKDAVDDSIVVTILTGVGDYFSSGNDLTQPYDNTQEISDACDLVRNFVNTLIDYPKIIIAVVNGPAVGIAVTMLALCDVVYASDCAIFSTPFVALGICPEACSSYNFPRIMGRSKASELLLLGNKITAQEAYESNFISKVIPHEKLPEFLNSLHKYGALSIDAVKICKKLVMDNLKVDLHAINETEMATLFECTSGEQINFLNKSKL